VHYYSRWHNKIWTSWVWFTRKIDVFKEVSQTKKQIFLSMISENGLKKTMYSEEMVEDS
jgi:hypothetical protein